jgi:hypothetical protein
VHRSVPWNWMDTIGVASEAMARQVRQVLDKTGVEHRPRVAVVSWFSVKWKRRLAG